MRTIYKRISKVKEKKRKIDELMETGLPQTSLHKTIMGTKTKFKFDEVTGITTEFVKKLQKKLIQCMIITKIYSWHQIGC